MGVSRGLFRVLTAWQLPSPRMSEWSEREQGRRHDVSYDWANSIYAVGQTDQSWYNMGRHYPKVGTPEGRANWSHHVDWIPHLGTCLRGTVSTKYAKIHIELFTPNISEITPEAMRMLSCGIPHGCLSYASFMPSTTQTQSFPWLLKGGYSIK